MSQSIDGIMLSVFLPFSLSLLSPHTALSLSPIPAAFSSIDINSSMHDLPVYKGNQSCLSTLHTYYKHIVIVVLFFDLCLSSSDRSLNIPPKPDTPTIKNMGLYSFVLILIT